MYHVYNMGIGFCIVAAAGDAQRVIDIVGAHGKRAFRLGHTLHDPERRIVIEAFGIASQGKSFARS